MSRFIHQPHDKFFKQSMANRQVASEFFKTHLPAELLEKIDFSTLELQKETFIDEAYKSHAADVVYQVRLGQAPAYLYVLCEHQSEVDKIMAFRLLVYTVRIMELHEKRYSDQPLPLVYPIVVYTGENPWDAPLDFFELFGEQQASAREVWLKPYPLIDVQRLDNAVLRKQLWSGLMQFVLKFRYIQELATAYQIVFPWLSEIEQHQGIALGKNVLQYLIDGIETNNQQLFIEKAKEYLLPELRGEAMTLAQLFEKQGFEKGMQKGKLEGMQEALLATAKKLVLEGLSITKIEQVTGLPVSKIKALHPVEEI